MVGRRVFSLPSPPAGPCLSHSMRCGKRRRDFFLFSPFPSLFFFFLSSSFECACPIRTTLYSMKELRGRNDRCRGAAFFFPPSLFPFSFSLDRRLAALFYPRVRPGVKAGSSATKDERVLPFLSPPPPFSALEDQISCTRRRFFSPCRTPGIELGPRGGRPPFFFVPLFRPRATSPQNTHSKNPPPPPPSLSPALPFCSTRPSIPGADHAFGMMSGNLSRQSIRSEFFFPFPFLPSPLL